MSATAQVPSAPFAPATYQGINFFLGVDTYDAWGRPAALDVYFARRSATEYNYYVVLSALKALAGALPLLVSGSLSFDAAGTLLRTTASEPLRLPAPAGFDAPEIELDFRDTTMLVAPCNASALRQNGNRAAFGTSCSVAPDAGPTGPESLRSSPVLHFDACETDATRSFFVAANLPSLLPIQPTRWNATAPVPLSLRDEEGRDSTLHLYFRHLETSVWTYEVVDSQDEEGTVLGSGELTFNENGSLRRAEVSQPLRYVEPDGSVLSLGLDFGRGTDEGDLGVDGTTAFDSDASLSNVSARGFGPHIGDACAAAVLLDMGVDSIWRTLSTSSAKRPVATKSVSVHGILPESVPLRSAPLDPRLPASTASFASVTTIYDGSGSPWLLTFYATHVGPYEWQYTFVADGRKGSLDTGVSLLRFDARSLKLVRAGKPPPLRLPLDDGTPGPLLDLANFAPTEEGGSGFESLVPFPAEAAQAWLDVRDRQAQPR